MSNEAPQQQVVYQNVVKQPNGMAVTALVTGIIAFVTGWVPVLGIILGSVAALFGIIALVKKQSKGMSITGLILGALALVTSVVMTAGAAMFTTDLMEALEEEPAMVEMGDTEEPAADPGHSENSEPETAPEPAEKERLTLDEGWTAETDDFGVYTVVKGYVSNNSDKAITGYVQITFDTLDADGANLGTCLANTNTIDANGRWKFEAMCLDDSDDIAQVRFKEISGF